MVDTGQDIRNSRGLSRRDMIKGAAVAGAAAWTAPMIIDSLTSPAAAASGCNIYWVKVTSTGTCFSACPGSGDGYSFPVNDAKWAGSCSHPSGCDAGDGSTHMPTVTNENSDYFKVVLPTGCRFSTVTDWQLGRRTSDDDYYKVTDTTCASVPASGNGCFTNETNTGWVRRGSPNTGGWIYLKFCCTS
jgi:hypothetical protein